MLTLTEEELLENLRMAQEREDSIHKIFLADKEAHLQALAERKKYVQGQAPFDNAIGKAHRRMMDSMTADAECHQSTQAAERALEEFRRRKP
jgi:hypothetical protein